MSIKVRDLAKELEVASDEVLEQLRKLYVDVEDGNSKVTDKIAGLIRIKLGGSISAKKKKPPKEKKIPVKEKKKQEVKPIEPVSPVKPVGETKVKETKTKTKISTSEKADEPNQKIKSLRMPEIVSRAPQKTERKELKSRSNPKTAKDGIEKITQVKPVKSVKHEIREIFDKNNEDIFKKPVYAKKGKKGKYKPAIEVVEKGTISKSKNKMSKKEQEFAAAFLKPATFDGKQPLTRKALQKIQIQMPVSVRVLAPRINIKPNLIIQYLMDKGAFININQDLEEGIARDIMAHFGYELEVSQTIEALERELMAEHHDHKKAAGIARAPVVTFMGHVDHGKTSLLDYIRKTMVTKDEKGGITQHIGAYKVEMPKGSVTFLDTPGHAAFTAMRARGANATDVVVLVVAADDGVMPQTKEAIDHARAANVPIVVAINKCDLPGANPDHVKKGLQQEGLTPEDWGGKTIMVEVSALTGEGVDHLVEMLMLESEMLELKANPKLRARGVVIESKKTPGQGVVATLLVQNGTLRGGDVVLCGIYYGKVKAMMNNLGERIQEAFPSTPVEILGLQGVPSAGEEFFVVKDEKKAKTLAVLKQGADRHKNMAGSQRVTLEDLYARILEGEIKELKIILKTDVQGSAEALKQSLQQLSASEVKVSLIHTAVGNINESDVMLAMVSNAIIIGFNVKIDSQSESLAKNEKIDFHIYDVIYEAMADVKAGMEGLLEPEEIEVFQGTAQIREIFPSKTGKAAGCAVTKGVIHRKDKIRIKRGQEIVFEGEINFLKRFKDDVRDVKDGFECGISIKGFNDIRKNDIIEAFIIEKVARRLKA